MDTEQDNRYRMPENDCHGTCKTPIGCTCDNTGSEKEGSAPEDAGTAQAEEHSGQPPNKEKPAGRPAWGCCRKNKSCCMGKNKLEVYDWLNDIPLAHQETQMVEVQFKNTRKGYYLNSNNLELSTGDMVAVEASPGHDVGEVTMTGKLVKLQMLKNNYRSEIKRVYRIAKQSDLDKLYEARGREHKTMLRAREIAENMALNMKISDVEYQGDGNKAIYYYIADERVDFRQLIKVYASEFRVKIEMKQIGARQEAGRVGGIGPCGRELCCSSSMSNFVSVSTSAARLQDIPLNPQKLAGQCGKLKCCLNFETDVYVEAQKSLPPRDAVLETKDSSYYYFKTDVLAGLITYSTDKNFGANLITIPKERVFEIIRMNRKGKKPAHLESESQMTEEKHTTHDVLEQESISRFDDEKANRKRKKKKKRPSGGENTPQASAPNLVKANPEQRNQQASDKPVRNRENNNRRNPNRQNNNNNNHPPKKNYEKKDNRNPQP